MGLPLSVVFQQFFELCLSESDIGRLTRDFVPKEYLPSMATSLFAHLALQFGTQPENLATEALGYVLQNSEAARAAVRDLLLGLGSNDRRRSPPTPRSLAAKTSRGPISSGAPQPVTARGSPRAAAMTWTRR